MSPLGGGHTAVQPPWDMSCPHSAAAKGLHPIPIPPYPCLCATGAAWGCSVLGSPTGAQSLITFSQSFPSKPGFAHKRCSQAPELSSALRPRPHASNIYLFILQKHLCSGLFIFCEKSLPCKAFPGPLRGQDLMHPHSPLPAPWGGPRSAGWGHPLVTRPVLGGDAEMGRYRGVKPSWDVLFPVYGQDRDKGVTFERALPPSRRGAGM